jgi:UDP-3-O-[3-hydroxymyristoyl] glucosamine N-acyltransferase
MKLKHNTSLKAVAEILDKPFVGNPDLIVNGLNEIHKVTEGDVTFTDHPKYYDRALTSATSVVIINSHVDCPEGKGIIISDDPFRDYNRLVKYFYPTVVPPAGNYYASEDAVIGEGSVIRNGVFIDEDVTIGKNCVIHPNVTIYRGSHIGDNVIIHANTTIGSDAFYYKKRPEGFDKLLSCGRVIIHDNVEIGSGCTIDKGVSGDTIIGWGSKLDNQIHIGHGVVLGKNCLIAAQTGIGGKTIIDDDVMIWGQVGIQKDIHIGKGAIILAQSGVTKSIEGGKTYFGSPAAETKKTYRELAALRYLPDLLDQMRKNK